MGVRKLISAAIRRWWIILALLLLGAGVAYLSVYLQKPMYEADMTLYIINPQDRESIQRIVQQYTEVIDSRTVTSEVLRKVNNSITEKELSSMVSIISKEDSNLFTIKVLWTNAAISSNVANAVGQEFLLQINKVMSRDTLAILDPAIIPDKQVPNNLWKKVFLGLLAGTILSIGTIYILEYYDTKIHSVEDIEEVLNTRVIGIIPEYNIDKGGNILGIKKL